LPFHRRLSGVFSIFRSCAFSLPPNDRRPSLAGCAGSLPFACASLLLRSDELCPPDLFRASAGDRGSLCPAHAAAERSAAGDRMGAGRRSGPPLSRAAVCDCQPGDVTAAGRPSALPRIATPRVLGVDDWAWKRGQRYGTILGDLATHRVVALLPVRTAEALAAWRQAHPGVEIISRDRAGSYAEGARLGTPQAQQAAERWPLLRNLSDGTCQQQ
jgi:Transposase